MIVIKPLELVDFKLPALPPIQRLATIVVEVIAKGAVPIASVEVS